MQFKSKFLSDSGIHPELNAELETNKRMDRRLNNVFCQWSVLTNHKTKMRSVKFGLQ